MATWQVRPEQVANSTLASLCPGSVSPLANSTQNGPVIECPTRVSGELPRNSRATFPKADFHRKKDEGWDLWVTSAALLWVGGFGGELGQCYSLAGTEQRPPPRGLVRRASLPFCGGRGAPASHLVLTGSPWSLSFSWRESIWCRAGLAPVILWGRKEAIESQPWKL